MQDRPDKAALLDAVAGFLLQEIRPQVVDPALNFRVLIAANLAAVVARETRLEETHDAAQLKRLRGILPDVDIAELADSRRRADRTAALKTLDQELANRIRSGEIEEAQMGALWAHVNATLGEKLQVVNPQFNTNAVIEH